jgi:hypothetical protein
MAHYWPYCSTVFPVTLEQQYEIILWCRSQFGDLSFQHWTSQISNSKLTVYFCDKLLKTQFDLTWCDLQQS